MTRQLAALVLGVIALGCMDMEQDAARVRTDVRRMQSEVDQHHENVAALRSMTGVMPELDRHEHSMDATMDRMTGHMGEMSHCSGIDIRELHDGMNDLRLEMGFHRQQLEGAPDLAYVQNACTDYCANMNETLDGMASVAAGGCME